MATALPPSTLPLPEVATPVPPVFVLLPLPEFATPVLLALVLPLTEVPGAPVPALPDVAALLPLLPVDVPVAPEEDAPPEALALEPLPGISMPLSRICLPSELRLTTGT